MWPPWMAEHLRRKGHNVEGVVERDDLIGEPDEVVFEAAQNEQRAVVTENLPDYRQLANEALAMGESHHGLVLTSNRSWPRHRRDTAAALATALDELLNQRPADDALLNQEWWPRRA